MTVRNYLEDTFNLIHQVTAITINIPDLEERINHFIVMKNGFIFSLIIDGMEQKVISCSNKSIRNASFSGKKKFHTFTKLIGVSREGFVWFLSPSYLGSLNDINLCSFPENFIFRKLHPQEKIMGDLGFKGLEKLQIYTMESNNYPENYEHDFMHFRSLVENVIGQIRKWKICKHDFQSKMVDLEKASNYHHFVFEIICGLTNLFVCPLRDYSYQ